MGWLALVAPFTSLGVKSGEKWVVSARGLEVGDEVPEGS